MADDNDKESQLLRAFIASSDKTYKKVLAKDGRTMHFADGKPVSQRTFNMVSERYLEIEGQYVKVAVPSNKGPGYERIKVSPRDVGALGAELRRARSDVPGTPVEKVKIGDKRYDIDDIIELNKEIAERSDKSYSEAVFKYHR